jgi:hypothetical protein
VIILKKISIIISFVFLFIAGCGNQTSSQHSKHAENEKNNQSGNPKQHAEHGDIREETKSAQVLPQFLDSKHENITAVYAAAAKYKELLEQIPCYCGCNESVAHRDNYDCFIHENKENGAVVWDDHGTKCEVCLVIASESISQFNEGKSLKEIRQYIDQKYKNGFPKPTPTPMPKG